MTGAAVVTGAGRGIGLQLATLLAQQGWAVFATCRSTSAELQRLAGASENVTIVPSVDVGKDGGCQALTQLPADHLDLLICNAGTLANDTIGNIDFDACRQQFEVNALGPLRCVEALQGKLQQGSKVVLIGSLLGSIGKNKTGKRYGYRMSKCAAHMAAVSLAADLKEAGVAVGIVHPGVVQTDMIRVSGSTSDLPADVSAKGILEQVDSLCMENSGSFCDYKGDSLPF